MEKSAIPSEEFFSPFSRIFVSRGSSLSASSHPLPFHTSRFTLQHPAAAVKMDVHMKNLTEMMRAHEGFTGSTRYVCKGEWAYEMSFVFADGGSFGAWKESETRDKVHAEYLKALEDCGIKEDDVYAGARVHDKW